VKQIRLEDVGEQGPAQAPVRPAPGTAVSIAIDVSRSTLVYCIRWDGAERRRLSTPAELRHLQAVVAQYREYQLHVAYEACGFGYEPAWWLQEQQIAVTVIAPSRVERAPGRTVKTDRVDAGKLARKLEQRELKGIYIPPRPIHEHRQLGRTYAQCLKERKRAQIRIRSLMQEQGRLGPLPTAGWTAYATWLGAQALPEPVRACVHAHQELRMLADRHARRLRRELGEVARRAPYQPVVRALQTQAGVGTFSAICLVLELGDIARFATGAALAHYLGLTPSQYSSGEVDRRGHILKCGPGPLRGLLLQCAWAAIRPGRDATLAAVFERLAPRAGRKRAIVAVARRLAVKLHRRWWTVVHQMEAPAPH
jgi:transposase